LPQARKKPRISEPASSQILHRLSESIFILTILLAVYLVACLGSYDPTDPGPFNSVASDRVHNLGRLLGAWMANFLLFLTGYLAYTFPVLLVFIGWLFYDRAGKPTEKATASEWLARLTGLLLFVLSATGLAHMHSYPPAGSMPAGGGGVIGLQIAMPLVEMTGALGSTLFLLAMLLVGLTLFAGISWFKVMDGIGKYTLDGLAWLVTTVVQLRDWFAGRRAKAKRVEVRKADSVRQKGKPKVKIEPQITTAESQPSQRVAREKQQPLFKHLPAGSLPPLELLDEPPEQVAGYSTENLEALSRQVELKLADFGVQVDVVEVHPGPVITRFELQPAAGVKSAQITNLAKDLARGLSVISVRVVEVIPGKPTIGLEIPNAVRNTVYLSEILRSDLFDRSASPLTLALGKSIGGNPVIADIAKMPHVLVAGTTGSGKSVALNAMILSLLYKATPDELRLIMIDTKMIELGMYADIPHLLVPVVTEAKKAAAALKWAVTEMEQRYRKLASVGVRNLAQFNDLMAKEPGRTMPHPRTGEDVTLSHLPYIVIVIDEMADLMMTSKKEAELSITRLAQKSRAVGIHVIVATQRPSTDVITGVLKGNLPTRIAFQVASKVDSRVILDVMGAEKLLGQGDMLFTPPQTSQLSRVQGALVEDHEIKAIVDFVSQESAPAFNQELVQSATGTRPAGSETPGADQDDLFDEAVRIILKSKRGSASLLQRALGIGYTRASRLIDIMTSEGIVGEHKGSKAREVLMSLDDWEELQSALASQGNSHE